MPKRKAARPSPLRLVAALLLYWDGDGDGDVDASDLMDWDGDGTIDALGSLSLLVKLLVVAFAAQQLLRWASGLRRRGRRVRELLVFACSPRVAALPNALFEATEVSKSCDAAIYARGDVTADVLRSALRDTDTRRFLFIGHADAPTSRSEDATRTLGFVLNDGTLAAARPQDLAVLLGRHSPKKGGRLELVFLNGCRSEALARAVRGEGVPYVVAWATSAHDEAARLFSRAFFEALGAGRASRGAKRRRPSTLAKLGRRLLDLARPEASAARDAYAQAYQEAVDAIAFETRLGTLANGVRSHVPRFELRDPHGAASSAHDCAPPPAASGLPLFLSESLERRGAESPVRPPTLAYAAPAGLVGEAYRSLLRLLTPGGGKKDDDLPYADPPVTPR